MGKSLLMHEKLEIHHLYLLGEKQKTLAAQYGVSQPTVSNAIHEIDRKNAIPAFHAAYRTYIAKKFGTAKVTKEVKKNECGYVIDEVTVSPTVYEKAVKVLITDGEWVPISGESL